MPDYKVLKDFFDRHHHKLMESIHSVHLCACSPCRYGKANAMTPNDRKDDEMIGGKRELEFQDIIAEEPRCAVCGLHYRDQTTATRCEVWCRENQSCNLEITRESIERSARK